MSTAEPLEQLYEVFSKYRRKLRAGTASADEDLETKRRLSRTPLRELSSADAMAATAYCDDSRDVGSLKHFLPRLVEVGLKPGEGALLRTAERLLEAAAWSTWSEEERAALEPFRELLGLRAR